MEGQTAVWDNTGRGVINLTEVNENAGVTPVTPGEYEFFVDSAEFGESAKGNPMITLKLKIDDEEADEANNGRTLYYHLVLNGAFGLGNLKKAALVLNPEGDLANFNPEECDDFFTGTRGRAKVINRTYNGDRVANVKTLLPSREAGFFNTN